MGRRGCRFVSMENSPNISPMQRTTAWQYSGHSAHEGVVGGSFNVMMNKVRG